MEIHLIRHPKVEVSSGICYGQTDVLLSEEGKEMIQNLSLDSDYDLIFSSPLQRCKAILDYHNLVYKIDNRLMEMNFGSWELVNWNDIPKQEIIPWYKDYINVRTTNGESLIDLRNRVKLFLEELISNYPDKKILIITHAGVIRVMLNLILEIPLGDIFNYSPDYCKKTILKKELSDWKLIGFNQ